MVYATYYILLPKSYWGIPRDCNLTNALCFATYLMLLQVFFEGILYTQNRVILAYLLPPDFFGKSKNIKKIGSIL